MRFLPRKYLSGFFVQLHFPMHARETIGSCGIQSKLFFMPFPMISSSQLYAALYYSKGVPQMISTLLTIQTQNQQYSSSSIYKYFGHAFVYDFKHAIII